MRYRILDCDGNVVGKAGSWAKAEKAATEFEKKNQYGSPDMLDKLERRYAVLEPIDDEKS